MWLTPASIGFVRLLVAVFPLKGMMEGRKGEGKRQVQVPGLKSEKQGGPLRFRDLTTQIHCAATEVSGHTPGRSVQTQRIVLKRCRARASLGVCGTAKMAVECRDTGSGLSDLATERCWITNCYQTQISMIFVGRLKKQSEEWVI